MYLSWEREEVSLSCLWQGNTGDRARGNWIYSLKPRLSITDFCFLKSARHAKSRMVSLGSRSPEILVNNTTHRPKQNLDWKLVPYIKTLDSVHVHVVVCRAYFVMRSGSWWGLAVDEAWQLMRPGSWWGRAGRRWCSLVPRSWVWRVLVTTHFAQCVTTM